MLSEECLKQLEWQNQLFMKKIDEMFKDFRTSILKCQYINSADEEKTHQKDEEESTIATNEEHFEEGNTDVVEFTIYDPDFFKRTTEEVKKHSDGSGDDSLNNTRAAFEAEDGAIARNEENFEEENTDVVDFTLYDQYENESSYDESKIVDEIRFIDIVFGDEEHKTETNQLQIGIENTKTTAVYENPSSHLDLRTTLSKKFAISNTADGAEGVFGEEKPFIKCDEALAVDLTWVTGAVLDKEKAKEEEQETIVLDKAKDGPQTRAVHHTSSIFLRNLTTSITNTKIEVVCQKFDGYSCVAIDKEADGGDDNQDAEEKSNLDKDRDGPLKLEGEHENNDTGIVLEAVEKKISEEETAAIHDEGINGAAEDSDDREERQQEEKLKIEKPGEEKTAKLWSCVPGYFCHKFRKRKQTKDSFVDKIISYN